MVFAGGMKKQRASGGASLRNGSVLMEFVVVAPLYFILLGGLFMVGDLVTNRVRFHIGEHFVTWVGASRFCPVVKDGANKGDKDPEQVKALIKPMYDLSIGGAVDDAGFRVDTPEEMSSQGQIYHNNFMQFYMGRIKSIPIAMPEWARGMYQMENAMQGSSDMDEYSSVVYERKGEDFHSYSFHRLLLPGIDDDNFNAIDNYSRSKAVSAGQLAADEDNILSNVIGGDKWVNELGEENGGQPNPVLKFHRHDSEDVHRFLGLFAQ